MKSRLLSVVRRRGRPIAWTQDMRGGWGNVLFLYLWAYTLRRSGDEVYVLTSPRFDAWYRYFPGLRPLSVTPDEVRFTDQRLMPWSATARARGDPRTVPPNEQVDVAMVEAFVREGLLPGSPLERPPGSDASAGQELVVNVRRGNYYSIPSQRARYGFDVESYLRVAVPRALATRPVARIRVVSDGLDWCREQLAWLGDHAPLVSFADRTGGPIGDFETVARCRRILLTNSTFSYWAAYVSNALYDDNHRDVWAPAFFDRTQNGGRSWLLDPRWSVVESLPSGWDL